MNLKQAFRYQKFLSSMISEASYKLTERENALKCTETHKLHEVNQDASDRIDTVCMNEGYVGNDIMIDIAVHLINEKEKLSTEICKAKNYSKYSCNFYMDAEIETNKQRQLVAYSISEMLKSKAKTTKRNGTAYKFNNDGVQAPYVYEIESEYTEAFDRDKAKKIMKALTNEAEKYSEEIDKVMANTTVDYDPPYDVTSSFESVVSEYIDNNIQ